MKINLTFEMSESEVLGRAKLFKKNFLDEDFSKDFNAEYEKNRRELEEAQKRFDVRHEQNMKALEELEHELKGLQ